MLKQVETFVHVALSTLSGADRESFSRRMDCVFNYIHVTTTAMLEQRQMIKSMRSRREQFEIDNEVRFQPPFHSFDAHSRSVVDIGRDHTVEVLDGDPCA
jgi:hypothetical protein